MSKKEDSASKADFVEKMRHTLSHVMAAAVKSMYPDAKFGIGPAIDNGFYYDIDFGKTKISESDLKRIEKKMRGIIQRKLEMTKREVGREEALNWAIEEGQDFKKELIEELPEDEKITFYDLGDLFSDLCKGPHVKNTSECGPFKLIRVAGAYWKGDEKREMLTRIYGVGFETEAELEVYLKRQEEAKNRDHRKLGKELDLFCNSPLVGSGLPLFTPRGTILRDLLNRFAQSYREDRGYQKVCIPHIALVDLYKTSGHYAKFPELLKFTSSESGDELALKELPVKYLETTMVYRDERKGELGGLSRVRAITQDDSHVFCTEDQIGDIFGELIESAKDLYAKVGMKLRLRLSFRDDGDGYIGTPEMWKKAEDSIKKMADKYEMDYFIGIGEAAMYGPKMDFMAVDALDREWQLATVQLDYAQPERFGLEYIAEDGSKKRPVMVHCALIGSIERFMSVFIEHTAGWFPFWCAPEQIRILTVNDQVLDYVADIKKELEKVVLDDPISNNPLRYSVDNSSESLGKKIKRATEMKIPCIMIVGPKDAESKEVSVRIHDEKSEGGVREEKIKLSALAKNLQKM